jgi:hypothetical protein
MARNEFVDSLSLLLPTEPGRDPGRKDSEPVGVLSLVGDDVVDVDGAKETLPPPLALLLFGFVDNKLVPLEVSCDDCCDGGCCEGGGDVGREGFSVLLTTDEEEASGG